jgi:hypothetical protein
MAFVNSVGWISNQQVENEVSVRGINLSHNKSERFHGNSMDAAKTIDTQVTLPIELYQMLVQQAQAHGHSVSSEIVALLVPMLGQDSTELAQEFAAWEAASDEDWLNIEVTLASQEN